MHSTFHCLGQSFNQSFNQSINQETKQSSRSSIEIIEINQSRILIELHLFVPLKLLSCYKYLLYVHGSRTYATLI